MKATAIKIPINAGRLIIKKLTLTLLSIAMGLLLGNHYSLVTRKLLPEYIVSVYRSVRFINNESKLITVENNFKKQSWV
jgi:hypothetical protein